MRYWTMLFTLLVASFQASYAAETQTTPAPGAVFYVSPSGNDAWSGRLAEPNAAKSDGPLATLRQARDAVRKLKQAGALPAGGVTVFLRGGNHFVPETLKLEAQDSGTAGAPVVYRAYKDERPVLIGGRAITGFTSYRGEILQADVATQGFKGAAFKQLFFDGRRQHLARYPNFDPANPYGGGWAYADGKPVPMYANVPGEDRRTLHYKAQDARTWSRVQEAEVFVFPRYNWWNNIVRIKQVDPEKRIITLVGDCSYPIRPTDRYYVRGLLEELDAPGEWYLDRQAGKLYFWPPAALAGKTVCAPTTRTILEIGPKAEHITIQGLTIECCDGTAVVLKETSDCLVAGNVIRNVGDYNGSGVGVSDGRRNGVVGNDIYEIGSNGVSLSGGDRITLTPAENFADNNYIHHIGVFYKQGVGVSLKGVGNRAAHNLIHDCPRMGIMFSGNNLVIEYNHIRHVNLETADTGAIYTGGRDWISSRGTVIRYNYFHDILGYGQEHGEWVSPHFAWGVYLDDNTGGVDVIGNIVARSVRGLIHLHNGRDNLVENNVFVGGKLQQIECNGWTTDHRHWVDHFPSMVKGYESVAAQPAWQGMRNMKTHPKDAVLPDGTIMSGNVFRRNILSYDDPASKLISTRTFSLEHNASDHNLVYHFGLPIETGLFKVKSTQGPNLVANGGFEEGKPGEMPTAWRWQARATPDSKAVAVQQAPFAGRQCLAITGGVGKDAKGATQYPIVVGNPIPVKPGQAFMLTVRVKAERPGAQAVVMAQSYVANAYFWSKETRVKAGTDWKEYELVFQMPRSDERGYHAQMKEVRVRVDFREESGTLWVDDVCVKEATALDSWQSWQAAGMDQHSIVADPLFVDAKHDDYRLRPESPAFGLGFKPIPVEKIGPYRDVLRASWPIVEASGARETPLVAKKP